MHIQMTTLVTVFDAARFQEHVCIQTLNMPGISDGQVWFTAARQGQAPSQIMTRLLVPIAESFGPGGCSLKEFVLPFFEHFRPEDRNRNLHFAGLGSGGGFGVHARSARRVRGSTYEEHELRFSLLFPVTGGGVVRLELEGNAVDIANPTFDPFASYRPLVSEGQLREALARIHRPYDETASGIRASRIAEVEARMADARHELEDDFALAEAVEQEKQTSLKKTIWDRMRNGE